MRPNIKQMKERIEFLYHQLDLEIAHWKHAEEQIEALEEQKEALNKEYELKETNKNYQEEIVSLKSSLNNRPLEGSHYCDCGAQAYIYYMIDGGKYYCGECFQGKHIKNLGVALKQRQNQKNTIDVQTQTLNEQAEKICSLEVENKNLKDKYMKKINEVICLTEKYGDPQNMRCYCGSDAIIRYKNEVYCEDCFKRKVIKFYE